MSKIDTILEQMIPLNAKEAGDLANLLAEKLGITLNAGIVTAVAAEAPKDAGADKTITLKGFPADKKMTVLKLIKDLLGLGLMEAKTFVESVPKIVKDGVPAEEADELVKKLQEAGAEVDVK